MHDVDESLASRFKNEHRWKAGDAYSALIGLNQSLTVMIVQKVPFSVIMGIILNYVKIVGNIAIPIGWKPVGSMKTVTY